MRPHRQALFHKRDELPSRFLAARVDIMRRMLTMAIGVRKALRIGFKRQLVGSAPGGPGQDLEHGAVAICSAFSSLCPSSKRARKVADIKSPRPFGASPISRCSAICAWPPLTSRLPVLPAIIAGAEVTSTRARPQRLRRRDHRQAASARSAPDNQPSSWIFGCRDIGDWNQIAGDRLGHRVGDIKPANIADHRITHIKRFRIGIAHRSHQSRHLLRLARLAKITREHRTDLAKPGRPDKDHQSVRKFVFSRHDSGGAGMTGMPGKNHGRQAQTGKPSVSSANTAARLPTDPRTT
jgi:hypothetical protein